MAKKFIICKGRRSGITTLQNKLKTLQDENTKLKEELNCIKSCLLASQRNDLEAKCDSIIATMNNITLTNNQVINSKPAICSETDVISFFAKLVTLQQHYKEYTKSGTDIQTSQHVLKFD